MRATTSTYYLLHESGAVYSHTVAESRKQAIRHFVDQAVQAGRLESQSECCISRAEEFILTADEYHNQFPQWRAEFCKALSVKG